jgi:hypothetical protein
MNTIETVTTAATPIKIGLTLGCFPVCSLV